MTREEMIAKMRNKASGMARPGFGGDRFKPEDGRHFIRILSGEDYKVCDGTTSFELYQHWIKIDGKTRPFYCGANTMMVEPDESKCRFCQTWSLLGLIEEACGDDKEYAELLKLTSLTRKKFSYRSSSVMNVIVRGKGDKPDKAMLWGCPPTVAQAILNTVADNMDEDADFDPFHPQHGWDWILTRSTDKNNTSYTVALKTKPSPIGDYEGEITDLDKMFANEVKQAASEKNVTAAEEVITNLLTPVFEMADEVGLDINHLRDGRQSKPKSQPKPQSKRPSLDEDAGEDDRSKVKTKTASAIAASKIEHDEIPPDDDQEMLADAQRAIAEANGMFADDDDDDDVPY